MADLGMARRRRKAEAKGLEPGETLPRETSDATQPTVDLSPLRSAINDLDERLESIEARTGGDGDQLKLQEELLSLRESVIILESLASTATGKIETLQSALATMSIGKYDVEEFSV